MPIVYNVVRIRDGGSFTTRTVDAIQNGEVIFNMIVSFQIDEGGFEHQFDMPDVPGPNDLQSERELRESMIDEIPKEYRDGFLREKAFSLRKPSLYSLGISSIIDSLSSLSLCKSFGPGTSGMSN